MILMMDIVQLITTVLIVALFFFGFKFFESTWTFKINKPNKWENSIVKDDVPKKLTTLEKKYTDKVRFYNFWFQIERLKRDKIKGDFVELGVYQGETALLLHEMDKSRNLHLFDTFEGFDEKDLKKEQQTDERFSTDNFADTKLNEVKDLFKESENVFFYKGYFPETTRQLKANQFALVNIDADLYQPTIAALTYFYPRLSPGGVLIIHDYNHTWDGVPKAINEFLQTIPECLMEVPDWQGSAMIIKNRIFKG